MTVRTTGLRPARHRTLLAAVVALATVAGACAMPIGPRPPAPTTTTVAPAPRADYDVLAGVEQLYVIGALEGDELVVESDGTVVERGRADRLGSWAVRELEQGRTYDVVNRTSGDRRRVRILVADEHPGPEFYGATRLREGLNYVPMRDGITLAATVRPPIGQSLSNGPFPTLIEYSGYQIAAPNDPVANRLATALGLPTDPLSPTGETDLGGILMRMAGYAVVSVQIRGSGCSGGESDLFDLPTSLDGYDIVETVAAQSWVRRGQVGMVGISFSGFSQLAVAATRPPSLAAIAPFSYAGSLYDIAHPGGIFNNGFARSWMAERVRNARPAPDPGALAYANELVRRDPVCRANQRLRLQTRDGDGIIRSQDTYVADYERRDFRRAMARIDVPTFASLQFEDEETSAYALLDAATILGANDRVWLNVSNGHHNDSVTPETITELFEFLDIYVARRVPEPKLLVTLLSDLVFGDGSVRPPLPAFAPNLREAQRAFEARPRVRVLLELPRGSKSGANLGSRWTFRADAFPLPDSTERTFFLADGGRLVDTPGADAVAEYRPDPAARRDTTIELGGSGFVWEQVPEGNGVGFVTEPLESDLVALGPVGASIHLSSSAADTDLGLTLSEVRPDGTEQLVGVGVQRASARQVDPARATPTLPAFTQLTRLPLEAGVTEVPVQILPLGHVLRAGSRLRLSISAVGGDHERWAFDSVDPDGGLTTNRVHLGATHPSSITLTVVERSGYPASPLPCPSAGKPCRPWVPAANGG
jgi:predicted acyl esterase